MISILDNFLGAIILFFSIILLWSKTINKPINYKNYKFYLILIILSFISILNYYFSNSFLRLFLISVIMIGSSSYLFNISLKKSVFLIVLSQILIMIADGLVAIILTGVLDLNSYSSNLYFSKIIINLIASLIIIIFSIILPLSKLYYMILSKTNTIKQQQIIIVGLICILLVNLISITLYNNADFRVIIIINIIFSIFCFVIVFYLLKTKNNYIKVYDKYNTTLNSLKEYEDILDKYRVSNHENKNQLLTIRNMIPKENKEVISYIDKIVENKLKDNDKILFDVSIIPSGGLRGLIYSKVLTMKELNIDYELEISNKVKTVDLISLDDSLILDICQVIGVFLDNAIQEVENLEEKYINIEMYTEEESLIIEISNNYKGIIEIDKLNNKGYTSKGKGHGYGLSLVKEIIDNNKNLLNYNKISKESFTQVLKIKM